MNRLALFLVLLCGCSAPPSFEPFDPKPVQPRPPFAEIMPKVARQDSGEAIARTNRSCFCNIPAPWPNGNLLWDHEEEWNGLVEFDVKASADLTADPETWPTIATTRDHFLSNCPPFVWFRIGVHRIDFYSL